MAALVGNPEDRFSRVATHLSFEIIVENWLFFHILPKHLSNQGLLIIDSRSKVIKLFSSSTQLSMKFKLLINTKIVQIYKNLRSRMPASVIYPANNLTFITPG